MIITIIVILIISGVAAPEGTGTGGSKVCFGFGTAWHRAGGMQVLPNVTVPAEQGKMGDGQIFGEFLDTSLLLLLIIIMSISVVIITSHHHCLRYHLYQY